MASVPTAPAPGSMTVSPLFGWGEIVLVLLVLIGVAVAFFVIAAAATTARRREEWRQLLDARSARPAGTPATGGPVSRGRGGSPSA
jgi:hypothetical protein